MPTIVSAYIRRGLSSTVTIDTIRWSASDVVLAGTRGIDDEASTIVPVVPYGSSDTPA